MSTESALKNKVADVNDDGLRLWTDRKHGGVNALAVSFHVMCAMNKIVRDYVYLIRLPVGCGPRPFNALCERSAAGHSSYLASSVRINHLKPRRVRDMDTLYGTLCLKKTNTLDF